MNSRKTGALYLSITIALILFAISFYAIKFFSGKALNPLIAEFAMYPIILGFCLIFAFISRQRPASFFDFRRVKVPTFFLTMLYGFMILPITVFVGDISNLSFGNPLETITVLPLPVILILTNICAPFFEELLFRGALFNGYRRSGRPLAAIILTAVLFGLFHGNITQMIYTSLFGIFCGLIVEATGSLWMSIFLHFILNISGTLPLIIYTLHGNTSALSEENVSTVNSVLENEAAYNSLLVYAIIIAVVFFGIAILLVFLSGFVLRKIARIEGRENIYLKRAEPTASTGRSIWSIPLIIGICITVAGIGFNLLSAA